MRAFYIFLCLLLATFASVGQPDRYFKIKIVDGKSGRGVPLVELKNHQPVELLHGQQRYYRILRTRIDESGALFSYQKPWL